MTTAVAGSPAAIDDALRALESPAGLLRVLKTFPESSEFGRRSVPMSCPIHRYLKIETGHSLAVYPSSIGTGSAARPMPAWAQLFITQVDIPDDMSILPGSPVLVGECLAILRSEVLGVSCVGTPCTQTTEIDKLS